jgi:hypothetical protein
MTNGLFSDMFVQAEVDYRRDRAITDVHPKPRPQRSRHHRWSRARGTARPSISVHGPVD